MNIDSLDNNKAILQGEISSVPTFSHSVCGEGFYEFDLKVPRLSDTFDCVPITISERLMDETICENSKKCFSGSFRSYNKLTDSKSHLMLTLFVREVLEYDSNINPNQIELTGYVCKEPVYRVTPFKREICDMLLAVNRNYNKSDYLPCIAWGRNARFVKNVKVGDKIMINGRIQSRVYQKKVDDDVTQRVAYEISLNKVSKLSDSVYLNNSMSSYELMTNSL